MATHTVQAGDTLGTIAKKYYGDASKYDLIVTANHLADPNNIRVGQILQIPELAAPVQIAEPPIDKSRFRLPTSEYFTDPQLKRMIVLHFTAGLTAESAFNTFKNSPSRVATPYVVDRDGTIYELFPPEVWAIHLFRHKPGEFPVYYHLEKCTVPIEIANVGPLKPDASNPQQLNWWPPPDNTTGRESFKTKWCRLDEKEKFVKATDRGIDYFATFTNEQYTSMRALVDYLCNRFDIPKQAPADKLKMDLEGLADFRGIVTHQNFRQDKWDIGPAFEWGRIGV